MKGKVIISKENSMKFHSTLVMATPSWDSLAFGVYTGSALHGCDISHKQQ